MTKQRRTRNCAVLGALALLSFAAVKAWTQDVFASNGGGSSGTSVYQDSFSSNCDKTNHSSLAMDSPDPAVCFDSPAAANGECSPVGGKDSTPAGQTGNICHYCQKAAMPGKEIIIPSSGGIGFGTPSYDWICTANPSDGCYMSCFGNLPTPTLPPGSSVQQEKGQDGHPIFKITISNDPQPQTSTQPTPDPCYPAGPKNYNACDYPNVARPAGCECSKTPGPQPVAQLKPQPTPQPTSQTPDERNYLQGLVDGIGSCLQNLQGGLVNLAAGAGYFAQGNFVQAAQAWGLQPGQSLVLQSLYTEMTTPQVGVVNSVSDYQRGLAGGQRLCNYVLIPAATKAVGSALKGKPASPGSTPPRATPQPTAPSSAPPPRTGSTQPTGPNSAPPPRTGSTQPTGPNSAPPPRTGSTQPTGPKSAPPPRTGSTQPTDPNSAPPPRTGSTQPTGPKSAPPPRTGSTQPTGPNRPPPPPPDRTLPTAPKSVPPPDKTKPTTPLGPDGTLPTAPGGKP
ncbi:MAG: hypothetical protein ABSA85_08655 [Terracidiphilus sp.]